MYNIEINNQKLHKKLKIKFLQMRNTIRRERLHPFLCLVFSFAFTMAVAQDDAVYTQADQMPYFKGCSNAVAGTPEKRSCSNQALVAYIAQNLVVPPALDADGVVYVSFLIDESGKVQTPEVLRSLAPAQDQAALKVVREMPTWEPALLNDKPVKVKMTLPVRFRQREDADFSNGFQLTWGNLKGKNISKNDLTKIAAQPITVRDELGNVLEINELMFERERNGKFEDAHSKGAVNDEMLKLVKKLKSGDNFTLTATVQKRGQFFYVDRTFLVNN